MMYYFHALPSGSLSKVATKASFRCLVEAASLSEAKSLFEVKMMAIYPPLGTWRVTCRGENGRRFKPFSLSWTKDKRN